MNKIAAEREVAYPVADRKAIFPYSFSIQGQAGGRFRIPRNNERNS
jgi:hypothetical protein